MKTANTRISKWGNGQGVRIPRELMNELSIRVGDEIEMEVKDNSIIIKPALKRKTLAERFAEYSGPLKLTETGWAGPAVGKEVKW